MVQGQDTACVNNTGWDEVGGILPFSVRKTDFWVIFKKGGGVLLAFSGAFLPGSALSQCCCGCMDQASLPLGELVDHCAAAPGWETVVPSFMRRST
jgi:hypothetical protein